MAQIVKELRRCALDELNIRIVHIAVNTECTFIFLDFCIVIERTFFRQ